MDLILSYLFNWPIVMLIYIKSRVFGDKYAQLWYADIASFPNVNQFELLAKRPYYRTLLFHRLGAWG